MPIALGPGVPALANLHPQVLHLQSLDRLPVKPGFLGNVLDGGLTTASPHVVGKALGIEGLSARKSSSSLFTFPQPLHSTRRTSISTKMRASPHGRSRTRRVR